MFAIISQLTDDGQEFEAIGSLPMVRPCNRWIPADGPYGVCDAYSKTSAPETAVEEWEQILIDRINAGETEFTFSLYGITWAILAREQPAGDA